MISYSFFVSLLFFVYAYTKTKYRDSKSAAWRDSKKSSSSLLSSSSTSVAQLLSARLGFLYYFPLAGFLFGPVDAYITSYTRAASILCLIATHCAFSSLFVNTHILDVSRTTMQYYVAYMTIAASSFLAYVTLGRGGGGGCYN